MFGAIWLPSLPHYPRLTPGLWKDANSDLMFTLVVDDFGVRYTNQQDVDKLVSTLQNK
jgi:hypothetical protein